MGVQHPHHPRPQAVRQGSHLQDGRRRQAQAKIPQTGQCGQIRLGSGQTGQQGRSGMHAVGQPGQQTGPGGLLRIVQAPGRAQIAQFLFAEPGQGQGREHARLAHGPLSGPEGGQVVGIAAVTEDATAARGGQGLTQTAHEGPLAGIAALPAVHRHVGKGKGIVPHFPQGQPLRPGPTPRRRALGLRHMRPRGVQGQHVAARTPQGETEETAVQPAGKGHGQRPGPQHGQQGLPAGFGSYHVRRTLAPFPAMTSLHWRMVYCP